VRLYDSHGSEGQGRTDTATSGRGNTGGIREYARAHNYNNVEVVRQWSEAYRVAKTVKILDSLSSSILYEISKAPEPAWPMLKGYRYTSTRPRTP